MSEPNFTSQEHETVTEDGLKGLGGWLIWFQIRVYVSILMISKDIVDLGIHYFSLIFLALLASLIVCLVFFYRKKLVFRTIYVILIGVSFVATIFFWVYNPFILTDSFYLAIIIETIVIIALFLSKRVKNTFS